MASLRVRDTLPDSTSKTKDSLFYIQKTYGFLNIKKWTLPKKSAPPLRQGGGALI
jgi:hypothetical protein